MTKATRARTPYVSRTQANWILEDDILKPSMVAVWDDPAPVKTGLLDANGDPLYRLPDTLPVGFRSAQ